MGAHSKDDGNSMITAEQATEPDVLKMYGAEITGEWTSESGEGFLNLAFADVHSAAAWAEATGMRDNAVMPVASPIVSFTDRVTVRVRLF